MKYFFVFLFLMFFTFTSRANSNAVQIKADSLISKICRMRDTQRTQTGHLLSELWQLVEKNPGDMEIIAQYYYQVASFNDAQGIYDEPLVEKIKNCIEVVDENIYPLDCAILHYALALTYHANHNYLESFSASQRALKLFQEINDFYFTAQTYNLLGTIVMKMGIYNLASVYFKRSVHIYSPSHPEYAQAYLNLFLTLYYEREFLPAADSIRAFIPHIEAIGDTASLFTAYLRVGNCYNQVDYDAEAYRYYMLAKQLLTQIDNRRSTFSYNLSIGRYYRSASVSDYKNALAHFKVAERIATEDNNNYYLLIVLSDIVGTYTNMKDVARTSEYLRRIQMLSDDILKGSDLINTYKTFADEALSDSQKMAAGFAQQKMVERKRFMVILLLSVIIILFISALLFVLLRQKRSTNSEKEELAFHLEKEKEIRQLRDKHYNETIQTNVRVITSYSLQLSQKNEVLKQLSDLTAQCAPSCKIRKKIDSVVKNSLNSEKDWEHFKLYFDNVHPCFFDQLKTTCGDLTDANLRVCAFIRIGLPNKQIAQIMNISSESIITHRYRLKKKLDIPEEVSLDVFLRDL